MGEPITLQKALEITRDMLKNISVPMYLYDSVIAPIQSAIRNLEVCINSSKNEEQKSENTDNIIELTGDADIKGGD